MLLINCLKSIFSKCYTKYPSLQETLVFNSEKNYFLRKLLLFIYGLLIGILFCALVLLPIKLIPQKSIIYTGVAIASLLGCGCAFSIQIRCIASLVVLGLCGNAGRSVLKTVIFTFVLIGPVRNIVVNSEEVARVFSCTTSLTYNLTKAKFEFMTSPFSNAFLHLQNNLSHMQDNFLQIKNIVDPIKHEVEDAGLMTNKSKIIKRRQNREINQTAEQISQNYAAKLKKRCELQIDKGRQKCEKSFSDSYNGCFEKLPIIVNYLVCWPIKISIVCNLMESLGGVCDSSGMVDSDFGMNYIRLKQIENELMSNQQDVKIEYASMNPINSLAVKTANETGKAVVQEFKEKKKIFDYYIQLVQKLLAFIFIRIIYDAIKFHKVYLKNIEFNNYFITDYFKRIDKRREISNHKHLFPLKKLENTNLVDPETSKKISVEFDGYLWVLVELAFEIFTTTCFVLLDRLFFESLNIIASHAQIDYVQKGQHNMRISVNGSGFVAELIRSSLEGFNDENQLNSSTSNESCLPRPQLIKTWNIVRIYLLYLTIFYLIYNQVYLQRLKRVVCAYFYPKREKKRILHLYNNLLKRRRNFFNVITKTIKNKLRHQKIIQQEQTCIQNMLLNHPTSCKILKFFKCSRLRCFVCDEVEVSSKNLQKFSQCPEFLCSVIFCGDCWEEINHRCLVCKLRRDFSKIKKKNFESIMDYYLEFHKT